MGGDEFAILLPHTNLEQGRVFVKRMGEALETFIAPFEPRVTLSIGAAAYLGDKPLTIDELIAMADKGMYSVKKTSKDDAVFSVV
jgi:diguanylate cyclase (GGDEF)-like protein